MDKHDKHHKHDKKHHHQHVDKYADKRKHPLKPAEQQQQEVLNAISLKNQNDLKTHEGKEFSKKHEFDRKEAEKHKPEKYKPQKGR